MVQLTEQEVQYITDVLREVQDSCVAVEVQECLSILEYANSVPTPAGT